MHKILVKTPFWLRLLFPKYLWRKSLGEKVIYLTFDDGPTPKVTDWVLQQLDKYNAKATFFCVGENVEKHQAIFKTIAFKGHRIGNHGMRHENGWDVDTHTYLKSYSETQKFIPSNLFRPPYGRIKNRQAKELIKLGVEIVMWDVISGDFDPSILPKKCLANVLKHTQNGSIVVFHDSEKAFPNLSFTLPKMLDHFSKVGYRFEHL
ncbi:MAG: polysaccharide deacetylase family protein [Bacteroidetes bacterium]|nr:polysaccharide deacetylase family protein [Bacteroidota bacterium]